MSDLRQTIEAAWDNRDLLKETATQNAIREVIEELDNTEEQRYLIILKKALYLIKISNFSEGNNLLKKLIDKKSKYQYLAEETISK